MDVDTKDLFCFFMAPLKADNYYARSPDIDAVLWGDGLWKHVSKSKATQPEASESAAASSPCSGELEWEVRKRYLALAMILTAVDSSRKTLVRRRRCIWKAWQTLKDVFKAISESLIDAKQAFLQSATFEKGERVVKFSSNVLELEHELEDAGHKVTEIEHKRSLLRGMLGSFDVTV